MTSIEYKSISAVQCELTEECKNTACIFKLRDCHDFPVFWYSGFEGESSKEKQDRILNSLEMGKVTYPRFTANMGTNVIYVGCEDKKWED